MERNVMICFRDLCENVVLRADERLTNDHLRRFAAEQVGEEPSDIYDVKDEELQYYVIDGRCDFTSDEWVCHILKVVGALYYDMSQWQQDGTLKVQQGQFVEDSVFEDLLNSVPPAYYEGGWFQVGEPYTHDPESGRALYQTFCRLGEKGHQWKYIGLMLHRALRKAV